MRGSRSTAGASETRSTYGSTARASRTSSRPPPSPASPSNVIDVDEDNDDSHDDGDAAEAPVTSTSAHHCRSVASAPAQPSRSLTTFQTPRNGLTHVRSGSIHRKTGISLAIRDTTDPPLFCSVPGWNQSWVDNSWRGEPNAPKNESWVDQSWESNAPKTQASTRTNQSTSYIEEDTYDDGTYDDGTYDDDTNKRRGAPRDGERQCAGCHRL